MKNGVIQLQDSERYIVNAGSVGQPRDRDPKAGCGILDDEIWQFEFVRLAYDIDTAAKKIRDAGLPKVLSERLYEGT